MGYCNVAEVRASRDPAVVVGDLVLTHQSHRSAFVAKAADVLAKVPAAADAAEASTAYLAHLGLAALRRASFLPGERVAVVGLGAIGLATVALAKAFGASVTAVGNDDGRLALACEMGADRAVRDTGGPTPAEDSAAHVVVLTANAWQAFQTSLRLARPWGRIAMLGFPGRTEGAPSFNPLASEHVYDKQLAILGAGMPVAREGAPQAEAAVLAEGMGLLVGMIAERRLRLAPLVSEIVPWRDLPRVYERAAGAEKKLVTAVLDWSAS
jgi:threonine dehydrogenase-like Zn-dependent dehydrogenase